MNVLTDVLQRTRAQGSVFARTSLASPWGLRFAAEHAVHLHVVTRGSAWLRRGGEVRELREHDVLLLTGTTGYDLSDDPSSPAQPFRPGVALSGSTAPAVPGRTTLLCGAYDVLDRRTPLLTGLPDIVIAHGDDDHGEQLRRVLQLLETELRRDEAGAAVAADRLIDLLFVIALRTWLAQEPPQYGWWRALADPLVGTAVSALHADPSAGWTLQSLAQHVNTSRSALTHRFTTVIGVPPMTYLAQWRMTLARDLLLQRDRTIESVASAIGYGSPYAFSTAFRRHHDCSPRQWRDAQPPTLARPD